MEKSSLDIYNFLREQDLLQSSPPLWWPKAGTFEVVVGAILTQNTTWKNVEKSLKNLQSYLDLDSFVLLDEAALKEKIKPSGFYNQKAPRLVNIAHNIKKEFSNFKNFQNTVSRQWLLEQKGVGPESADAILCYACLREEMVVDSYTKRLLKTFDIVFKKYDDYKEFLERDLRESFSKEKLPMVFAEYHGMIVEYNKKKRL